MATAKQKLGIFGEQVVTQYCRCPRCKKVRSLRRLPTNFKCADVICDFCGFLAQVKACTVTNINQLPKRLLGAAWGPQKERMDSAIYFPLFIVLVHEKSFGIYYLSADLQKPELFLPRNPLKPSARRAGWQGFTYNLVHITPGAVVRVH